MELRNRPSAVWQARNYNHTRYFTTRQEARDWAKNQAASTRVSVAHLQDFQAYEEFTKGTTR